MMEDLRDLTQDEVEMVEMAIYAHEVSKFNRAARRTLRAYQEKLIADVRAQIGRGLKRILVVLPTGGGKTVCFAEIVRRTIIKAAAATALVLAHRRELVQQTSAKLTDADVEHGILMAGEPYQPLFHVQVASVATLHRRGVVDEKIEMPPATIIIVDEAHHVKAESWQAILAKYPDAIVLGFTATPARGDGRGLGDIFETMVLGPTVQELIDLGFLVPTQVYAPASIDTKGVETGADGDWKSGQLEERVDKPKVIGDIIGNFIEHGGKSAIAFFPGVGSSMHAAEEFNKVGIPAAHIDGTTPREERDAILAKLRAGEIRVVCNCMVLTEGFDAPDVDTIIIARPTKNLALYLQMVGRGLRTAAGKSVCTVIDHADVTRRHGFAEDPVSWTLDVDKRAASKKRKERHKTAAERITECPRCATLYSPPKCGHCGFEPKRQPKALDVADGELGLLEKNGKANGKNYSMAEKEAWYGQLAWIAADRGYKSGWAYHKYREKFGVGPPNGLKPLPTPPTPEVQAWVRHLAIRHAKGLERARAGDTPWPRSVNASTVGRACSCGSRNWSVEPPKGPHAAGLRCASCGKHGGWPEEECCGMTSEDLARWVAMGQRHRILRAAVAGLITVPGSTPSDIARSMRTCADLIEGGRFEQAMVEAVAKADAAKQKARA